MIAFHHEIRGELVGPIWWPAGEICSKPLAYDVTRENERFSEPLRLRDHALRATNDGDFQGCDMAGELITTATITRGERTYRRTRITPLSRFASIADMIADDDA